MRKWLIVIALIGLNGCVIFDAPTVGAADSGWRTRTGGPLSIAEIAALQQSCVPRQVTALLDPDRPVAIPVRDNAIYHPGGEGLANAPAVGLAAPDRPVEPGTRRVADLTAGSLDDCLYGKGLVRVR